MKSWSIWKRRRPTKTRPCNSCLASARWVLAQRGRGRAWLALKVKMLRAVAGSAAPGGRGGGLAKAQQRLSWGPTRCLSSPSPRRLLAVVSGGAAQIWAGFRLCVQLRACSTCVSVCSPACLLSAVAAETAVKLRIGLRSGWGGNRRAAKKKKWLFRDQPAAAATNEIVWKCLVPASSCGLHGFVLSQATMPPKV